MLQHQIFLQYVPEKMPLVGVIGTDDAEKLKRAYARGQYYIWVGILGGKI